MSKKGKKRKYIDLDQNIGEYDEEQEKKDIDKTLEFIQTTFSLTDDEMTDLLNYEFLDEDLRYFDRLASILIDRQEKEREEEEKKEKEKEKEKEKKEQVISEEKKDISKEEGKKSKLREYLESIDKKDDNKDDNMKNKIVKHKNKSPIKGNFSIKEAEEFLKSTKNKNEIDLHGKRLVESMYIVHNKIISLKQKKSEGSLKEITLTIITGVGYHSVGGKPVLHPNLTKWLKGERKYKVDEKSRAGHIFVTIY